MSKILIKGKKCPVARTLSVIGEKWTPLILRDFFFSEELKYSDFSKSFPEISPNILSSRLKKLIEFGLIEKKLYSDHPPRYSYGLTPEGRSLKPILVGLREWGKMHTRFK